MGVFCCMTHCGEMRTSGPKSVFYKKVRKNVRKVLTNYIKCDNILSIVGVRTEEVATATRKRREGKDMDYLNNNSFI
jgi:hypothetical protein